MADNTQIAQQRQISPTGRMKQLLEGPAMSGLIKSTLKDKAELFTASIIEVFGSDSYLQKFDPAAVAKECLKAATLNLPLSKALGFSWVVPYKGVPTFQIGWKGYVQLAQRTGQYKYINAGPVFEGELKKVSKLTGEVDIDGEAISDKIIGFFAYIELTNGYSKALYWTVEKMESHALKYVPECKKAGEIKGVWASDFEAMGTKTVLSTLIRRYGIMSTEMLGVIEDERDTEERVQAEIDGHANTEVVGFSPAEVVDMETGEVKTDEGASAEPSTAAAGPGF